MSRRSIYVVAAIAAIAATTALVGCTGGTAGQTASSSQRQAGSSSQPQAGSPSQPQASSATSQQASAVNACSLLTRDQVGGAFGTPFGGGTASSTIAPEAAVSSSGCRYETQTPDTEDPWSFTLDVFTFATDAPAQSLMTDYRRTANYLGTETYDNTEQGGVGDDALFHNLLSLRDGQETLIVRKGHVIYWFIDTIITGIPDTGEAQRELVSLALAVVNR